MSGVSDAAPRVTRRLRDGDRVLLFLGVCLVIGYFAIRGQFDDAPDRVRWLILVAGLGMAWSVPVGSGDRRRRFVPRIPPDIWPWLALAGALLFPQ